MRLTILFFLMQIAGTLLVLVVKPDVAFQGLKPLLLSTEGEFVVKNLVLIPGALVVSSTVRHRGRRGKDASGRERYHKE